MELHWWDRCLREWNGVNFISTSEGLVPLSRRHTLYTRFDGHLVHNHAPVDAQLCQKIVHCMHKYLNACIAEDDELSGTVDNLEDFDLGIRDSDDDMDDYAGLADLEIAQQRDKHDECEEKEV